MHRQRCQVADLQPPACWHGRAETEVVAHPRTSCGYLATPDGTKQDEADPESDQVEAAPGAGSLGAGPDTLATEAREPKVRLLVTFWLSDTVDLGETSAHDGIVGRSITVLPTRR